MDERGVDHRAPAPFDGLDRFEARAGGPRPRCARRAGSSPRSGPYLHARRALLALRDRSRAAAVAAVVRRRGAAGQGRRRRRTRRPGARSTRPSWSRATSAGSTTCTTGASAGSCGGGTGSRSGTARPARSSASARTTSRRPARAGRQDPDVLDTWFSSGAVAVLHAGLAGRHPRPRALLSDQRAGHRLRHPVLLGRPDDDVRALRHGRRAAVRRRRAARHGPRPARQEDVASRSATPSTRWTGWTPTAPTRCASPSPAAPTRAPTCRSARSGSQGSRNFCNKLWNATRFALLNGATTAGALPAGRRAVRRRPLDPVPAGRDGDAEVDALYEDFQFAKAADALYHFIWDEVCDWYLELAKVPLAARRPRRRRTRPVLGHVLDVVLRLLHPVVPFVTEALWTALTGGESVVVAPLAAGRPARRDPAAERRDRRAAGRWSPRCAGSGPSRGCGRASGSPRGSSGWRRPARRRTSRRSGRWPGSASRRRHRRLRRRPRRSSVRTATGSSSTCPARSTSPPSAAGWTRTWPRR